MIYRFIALRHEITEICSINRKQSSNWTVTLNKPCPCTLFCFMCEPECFYWLVLHLHSNTFCVFCMVKRNREQNHTTKKLAKFCNHFTLLKPRQTTKIVLPMDVVCIFMHYSNATIFGMLALDQFLQLLTNLHLQFCYNILLVATNYAILWLKQRALVIKQAAHLSNWFHAET